MTNIVDKYQDFLKIPFPDKLVGEELFDLVTLDTYATGLIDKYITRKGELSKPDFELLYKLNLELKSVINKLLGVELTYFSILSSLVNQVHSELKARQTY